MDINARKLLRLLNQPDITGALIDAAFEKDGRDIGVGIAEAILAERARIGAFSGVDELRRVKGVGPVKLDLMLAAAEAGALDELLAEMPNRLDPLPGAMRALGEALVGDGCTPVARRLENASRALAGRSRLNPALATMADELNQAAADCRAGLTPSLASTMAFSRIPAARLARKFPRDLRPELRSLNDRLESAKDALSLFSGAVWLGNAGPARAFDVGLRLRGDVGVARQLSFASARACQVADTAMTRAGMAYMSAANLFEGMLGVFVALLDLCSDDCEKGTVENCTATDVTIVPKGRDVDDADDFKTSISFLKALGQAIPGKYLTPGGKTLIKNIANELKGIKDQVDKKLVRLNGYSVFVLLTFDCCKQGLCGTYLDEQTTIVEIDPPNLGKRHRGNANNGWARRVIERLGDDAKRTASQLREFRTLAERMCPDGC